MSNAPLRDPCRTFDSASLTGSYQDVGAVMASPVIGMVIYNTSDVAIQLSFDDGTTSGPIIPSGATWSESAYSQANGVKTGDVIIKSGAQIQVKQVTAAGTGSIYVNIIRRIP